MSEKCNLCPRMCNADRGRVRGNGFCGCGMNPVISRAALHMWEEPVISGTAGSGTIFFGGCTLGCTFCQNYSISSSLHGREVTPEGLVGIMKDLERQGAHNISFVTGTQYIPAIISALKIYRPNVPTVWNSGGYERIETLLALSEYIDIWLPDYKFALSDVAAKYAYAPDYPQTALKAIKFMCELSDKNIIKNGMMKRGLIIRHLVLPHNIRNSVAVLREIDKNFPKGTLVSIMSQYTPAGNIENFPELGRRLNSQEYKKICKIAYTLEICGFMQELSSASEEYVPDFDMTELGD